MRILDLCLHYDPKMPESPLMLKFHMGLRPGIVKTLIPSRMVDEWTIEPRFASYKMPDTHQVTAPAKPISTRQKRPPRDISEWQCYNCNSKGYLCKNCPKLKDEAKVSARVEALKA